MVQNTDQSYTVDQIAAILSIIRDCINNNRYIVSKNENRQENVDFINEYNLCSQRQRAILLSITPRDFCHCLKNTKSGFEHEILYVFCPQVRLHSIVDHDEWVDIYIKFNIVEQGTGKFTIVISFHKRNKPIHYHLR